MNQSLRRFAPHMLGILRIVTALLFMEHGTAKLLNFPASEMHPPLFSIFGLAGVIEIVGGILVLIGFWTRPVAFLLSGQMAIAYWMVHAPQNFFPVNNGGDAAVLFCFVFLYLVFAGPGAFAMDNKRP